jgi:16S rRNA processing protein RimM
MGRIAAPHGVRGAIKVQPHSADPAALLIHPQWWLRMRTTRGGDWMPYRVLDGRRQAGLLVAVLEGVASREAAAALRGADVGVPRECLPALAENEHYQADLVGMAVVNRSGELLGNVTGFAESGAHPILRVTADGGALRLIPWIAQYIERVDVDARRIDVDWPTDY